ncbi:hypothetical protein Dimus_004237 [Dionaea muscipula]
MGSIYRRLEICSVNLQGPSSLRTTHLTHLQFLHPLASRFFAKPFSSAIDDELAVKSFLVSFLIDSCGLSSTRAVCVSDIYGERLGFSPARKPDGILELLRDHGFRTPHIARMISNWPLLLRVRCPQRTLLPKLEFFYSIGFTKEDLPALISKNPKYWLRSLEGHTRPVYSTLKAVLKSDDQVVHILKRARWGLPWMGEKNLGSNLVLLRGIGAPQSTIALMLKNFPSDMLAKHEKFCETVNEVKSLGFNVSKSVFALAVHVMTCGKAAKERCSKIYKEWGWSDDDILLAFQKAPLCLLVSEGKLKRTLDFLVNRMGCDAGAIAKYPVILLYNLERRIIPRCLVVQLLLEKGLIKKEWSLGSIMTTLESYFLKRYVNRYPDIAPQLLSVYTDSILRPSKTEKLS